MVRLFEVGKLDLVLDFKVGRQHVGGSGVFGMKGVLETDDVVVVSLGVRPLKRELVNVCHDIVKEDFDVIFDVEENVNRGRLAASPSGLWGDDVDEHGDLNVHSLEPVDQMLEPASSATFSGVMVHLLGC